MQHHYWITKQTLSQKLGRKEDECIVASDAELDTKLELLRNIQISCTLIQRIIEKYQESVCYLSQEINSMGRFLKENSNEDKTRVANVMLSIGKNLIFCAQEQLALHEPLTRFHKELETFRQRAIGDTLKNVLAMEKARTEYRAALSWMKNVSRQLDPDTSKQLEKFKKVQSQVRRGKENFDKLALDCLQKVDLLAAARCNMLNQTLSFYHNKLLQCTKKTTKIFITVEENVECSDKVLLEIQTQMSRDHNFENYCPHNNEQEELLFTERKTLIHEAISGTAIVQLKGIVNEFDLTETRKSSLTPDEYHNPSEKNLFTNCKTELDNNCVNHFNCEEESGFNSNFKNADNFLSSSILLESLTTITPESKTWMRTVLEDKNNVQPTNTNHNTKSWMTIFEELDPLSNQTEDRLMQHKNSC
ncbi:islet cell autoantigen 1 [Phymastichus coffea]|uniref:islet cell autoantigen 1 n=1 Tax=Phymastichus coffea TaxID=108790 RepID=UPI00273C234A|nr:islet cell autoantigen 1 [Phymastichus coffea]